MLKIKEIRDKSKPELSKAVAEKKEQIRKARFDIATKQVKNTRELRGARREVARMLTVINEQ